MCDPSSHSIFLIPSEREKESVQEHRHRPLIFVIFAIAKSEKIDNVESYKLKKSRIYVLRIHIYTYIRCTIIDRDSCPLHLVQRSQLYLERSKNPFNGYEGCRGSSKVAGFFFGSGARSRSYITATMNWVPLYCSIYWNIVYPPEIIGSRLPQYERARGICIVHIITNLHMNLHIYLWLDTKYGMVPYRAAVSLLTS